MNFSFLGDFVTAGGDFAAFPELTTVAQLLAGQEEALHLAAVVRVVGGTSALHVMSSGYTVLRQSTEVEALAV